MPGGPFFSDVRARDRTHNEKHAGQRVEPGTVAEPFQCVQSLLKGSVTCDRPDGFMHRLDRLASARRLEVGGAQAAGAVRCVPGDGTREGGRGGVLPERRQRDESPGEAVVTGRGKAAPAPRRSTTGRGGDRHFPHDASPIHRSRAGTDRAKRASPARPPSPPLSRGYPGAGASTGKGVPQASSRAAGQPDAHGNPRLRRSSLEARIGDAPSTCGSTSPRGGRATSAACIEARPAWSIAASTAGGSGGVQSTRGESMNVPSLSIASDASSARQAARPRSTPAGRTKPGMVTLSGPHGADDGAMQATPASLSRYSVDANAASTEPRPAMSTRRAGRPMHTAARAVPCIGGSESSIRCMSDTLTHSAETGSPFTNLLRHPG